MIAPPILCRTFIGRREELAYLHKRRLEAGSSRGGLVLVAGDAGLGKSRLIAEFVASLVYSRWRVGRGVCTEFAGRPYGPMLDVLARLDPGPPEIPPAESKQEQLRALAARFAGIAARRAVLVVFEDVHWADTATLDMLAHLGEELHCMRALVLASFRPGDLHPHHPATAGIEKVLRKARPARIDLTPFSGVELRTFIDESLTGTSLPDRVRRTVAQAGEGNPFFTEELLKSAVEQNRTSPDGSNGDLPPTIRATLLERLDFFTPEERRVVAQAAVIGRTFDLRLLATTLASEPDGLLPTLRRARDFQLIEEIEPMLFRFRHGLTREAIYGNFLRSELQLLHRTLAVTLESMPESDRSIEGLAYHWWAAGNGKRSATYNELAGDAAARVHAHEDAIAFYERALEGSHVDLMTRASILEKIAEKRLALTRTAEGQATYCEAADTFEAALCFEREAACRVHAAILAYIAGMQAPTEPLQAMLARLDASEYLARSRAHLGLAWLAATYGFPTKAAAHLEEVDPRSLTAAADIGWRFHNVAAWVAMTIGDLHAFRREHAAWLEAARTGEASRRVAAAHANGAMCFTFFGMHEEALQNIDAALRIAHDSRNPYVRESACAFGALTYLMCGDLERARDAVEQVPTTTENHVNFTFATAWGTIVAAHLGDEAMIEKWFDGFETGPERVPEVECGAGLAEIMVRRGRHRDAAALLHRVLPDCELVRGNVPTLLAVGRYGAPEDRVRARDYLLRAADAPVDVPERPALALFDALELRRTGRQDKASSLARDAAEGFRRLRFPLLAAAALEVAGDTEAALSLYRQYGAAYDVLRLGGKDADVATQFQRGKPAKTAALSGREREIAVLAGHGKSNVEIARELSISHKTVEKHLASIFQKLGISSRRQLRHNASERLV